MQTEGSVERGRAQEFIPSTPRRKKHEVRYPSFSAKIKVRHIGELLSCLWKGI